MYCPKKFSYETFLHEALQVMWKKNWTKIVYEDEHLFFLGTKRLKIVEHKEE